MCLLDSPFSLLFSFCEQAGTGNSTITHYLMINCFSGAKVTLQRVLLLFEKMSSWVIPKVVADAYGSGRLRQLLITTIKSQFKRGFTKVVVTRAGRLYYESGCKESFHSIDS